MRPGKRRSDMKVLLIDNEEATLETVSAALRRHRPEARLTSARLGEEGIEMVKRQRPDIVVLGVGLPDMGFGEALKRIREVSTVPVLAIAREAEEDEAVAVLEAGADDCMARPVLV
jgi:two-component system KDP operon response regulator KdpE